jgi:hypothetical protein
MTQDPSGVYPEPSQRVQDKFSIADFRLGENSDAQQFANLVCMAKLAV